MNYFKVSSVKKSNKEYKLCILGKSGVGKSCLTVNFVQEIFINKYHPTIEDVYKKTIEIDGEEYIIEIFDTTGIETFSTMRDLYIHNSQAFIIVYSITSQTTFDELHLIYNQIINIKKEQPTLILVGNKLDLSDNERVVHRDKGQTLADQWMCSFYETSAKNSTNVYQIFIDLIRQIDHRIPCVRKASRQEDILLPISLPINRYFSCPRFFRKKQKPTKSISKPDQS